MCLGQSQDICLVEMQDMCCVESWDMCFVQNEYEGNHRRGRPNAAPLPLWWRPKATIFVLALNKAHVLALNTAHVLHLNKADVLALNMAHVLRLNTKTYPMFTANTKEAAFGRLHKGGAAFGRPSFVVSSAPAVAPGGGRGQQK